MKRISIKFAFIKPILDRKIYLQRQMNQTSNKVMQMNQQLSKNKG